MTTTDTRRNEILRRSGKDPVVLDKRPTSEILQDEIPYFRWIKENQVIVRAGHRTWAELLKARFEAKQEKLDAENHERGQQTRTKR